MSKGSSSSSGALRRGRNITQSSGVTVTAVTQLKESDTSTTWKSERQNSPVLSSEVPMAAKARMAMAVAPSSGIADCFTTSMAASRGVHAALLTHEHTPSTMTIALSTSMPRAMISAPREMRSRATPQGSRKMKLPTIVSTSTKPISTPLRRPMKKSSTTITISTAWSRLPVKPWIAAVTAADCSETIPTSMPSGNWAWSSAARAARASPMTTTLPPEIGGDAQADGRLAVVAQQARGRLHVAAA